MDTPSLSLMDQKRVTHLKQLLNDAKGTDAEKFPIRWKGQRQYFVTVRVETDWVLLNLDNGRTRAEQEVVAAKKNNPNLFTNPLDDEAQKAQAEILRGLDERTLRTFEELKADLLARGQQEPGVVTAAGVLVNGNRRCVAMRDTKKMKYMNVIVLPEGATPKQIRALEVELQITHDFREEYSHLNRLLLIERLILEDGYSTEDVAELLRKSKEYIQNERGILALMMEYLKTVEDLGITLSHLDGKYEPFKQLYDRVNSMIDKGQDEEAERMKHNWFLGLIVDTPYRALRAVDENHGTEYIQASLEKDPLLKELVRSDPEGETQAVDLGPLAAISEPAPEENVAKLVIDRLVAIAKTNPEAIKPSPNATKLPEVGIMQRLQTAVRGSALTASLDAKDVRQSKEPITLVEEATAKVRRVSLEKALQFGLDGIAFLQSITILEEALKDLRAEYERLSK